MLDKQQTKMQSQKKKFTSIVQTLQQQYKSNILTYRSKYYELSDALNILYKDIKKHHFSIVNQKGYTYNQMDTQNDQFMQKEEKVQEEQYQPLSLIQYFRNFAENAGQFCKRFRKREVQVKQEMGKLFAIDASSHFLEALAQKNLQNFDLSLKVQQLTKALDFKALELRIASKTTQQYQRKFKTCENDFNTVVISISDMLKDCEKTETQLRQQNRLQRQVFQSHKIQFQRFKADFKFKPSLQQKANRVRQVLQKKYSDREQILLKQTQKILQNKYKNIINQSSVKQTKNQTIKQSFLKQNR